ncbi:MULTISPECIES: mycofactocin-coupled SDR family oxidoreductase [unclassified Actinoplanes]|uniref:mycofactocin-coupled SDR family oxidoreductase n=1 Tax=unclassified Actinoplanes TaxID=2626549 RepID=UPI0005BD9FCE|nr:MULTISPECIES: mycofactocin-coupled SDR family oxidoreductase [unclassified Actinoplanes]
MRVDSLEPVRPVAVITGAGRGIGAAVARALAADYDLVLGDAPGPAAETGLGYRLATLTELTAVAADCRAAGARVAARRCDVRDPGQVAELVAAAGGTPVAAVAVAGVIAADGPAWEQSPADLDRDLAVNLHGVANLARAAIPGMLGAADPSRCRFVAVVSSAAERGLPLLASYVAAKHAALGYIRALAADLGPSGITANAVLPGSTGTELLTRTARAYGLAGAQDFARHQRLGRLLTPAEVAAAVAWLCSAAASATTGAALAVDGGFTG